MGGGVLLAVEDRVLGGEVVARVDRQGAGLAEVAGGHGGLRCGGGDDRGRHAGAHDVAGGADVRDAGAQRRARPDGQLGAPLLVEALGLLRPAGRRGEAHHLVWAQVVQVHAVVAGGLGDRVERTGPDQGCR
ncbi:hypothetical protein ACFQX7_32840 [Luedemannella flava]